MENMSSSNLIAPPLGIEHHDFDPQGDVLLKLIRRAEKEELDEPDSETSSIADDEEEEDPDTFPGSDNVSAQTESLVDVAQDTPGEDVFTDAKSIVFLEQPVHMRVSSRHLMLASPVFAAMLEKDKFKEGTTLHMQGSVDIELPDDDPNALEVLFNIIHSRTRQVPRKVSLHTLTQIAILVNKYEMLDVIEIFSDMWIRRLRKRGLPDGEYCDSEEVMSWLFTSWVFEKPKIFKPITRVMIQRTPHNLEDHLDIPIPNTLLDVIQERRFEAIDALISIVTTRINQYADTPPQCIPICDPDDPHELAEGYACDSMFLGSLIKASAKIGIFPIPDRPFNGFAFDQLAERMKSMNLRSKCDGNLKGYWVRHACHGVRDEILEEVETLETGICGLDLNDFKKLDRG